MAAPVIESSTDISALGGDTFNVTLPLGTEADDLLLAIIAKDDDILVESDHGMTQAYGIQFVAGGNSTWCFYKIALAADITRGHMSFTGDKEDYVGRMYRITGFDSGTPIDVVDTIGATGTSDTPQAPSIETVTDDALVFATTGMDDNDTPYGITTGGWTEDLNVAVATAGIVIARKVMTNFGATGAVDYTTAASDGWAATQIAIRPAPSGQTFYQTLDAASISSSEFIKETSKNLSITTIPSSIFIKKISKDLVGATTPVTLILKKGFKTLISVTTPSALINGIKVALCSLIAVMSPSSSLIKKTQKDFSASTIPSIALGKSTFKILISDTTPEGILTKKTSKSLTLTSMPIAILNTAAIFTQILTVSCSSLISLAKKISKVFGTTSTSTILFLKKTSKSFAITSAPNALLDNIFQAVKTIVVTTTGLAGLAMQYIPGNGQMKRKLQRMLTTIFG